MSPTSATFSKAAPADVVFTVTPSTAVLTELQIGGVAVNSANYTYVLGVLKLKSSYLTTLTNGAKVFTGIMDGNGNISMTVTIAA